MSDARDLGGPTVLLCRELRWQVIRARGPTLGLIKPEMFGHCAEDRL